MNKMNETSQKPLFEEPFKPKREEGKSWAINETSRLAIWEGVDGGVFIIYTKDGKETPLRLSEKAAKMTAFAICDTIGMIGNPDMREAS